jgi:GntR family transcriptional repressor for pyruvate dehydrogenase complex
MVTLTRETSMTTPMSKTDRLKAHVKEQITSGAWPPGHQLPSRRDLMAEHGVSLTVVRDAQRDLRAEGWLVSQGGVAYWVAENPPIDRSE